MKFIFLNLIKNKKELLILCLSIILCIIAINNPILNIKKSITSYMLVVDVSQSMNAEDLILNKEKISRIMELNESFKTRVISSIEPF